MNWHAKFDVKFNAVEHGGELETTLEGTYQEIDLFADIAGAALKEYLAENWDLWIETAKEIRRAQRESGREKKIIADMEIMRAWAKERIE
jgi:hypothetical protein